MNKAVAYIQETVIANAGKPWTQVRVLILNGAEDWIARTSVAMRSKGAATSLRSQFGNALEQADKEHVMLEQAKRKGGCGIVDKIVDIYGKGALWILTTLIGRRVFAW